MGKKHVNGIATANIIRQNALQAQQIDVLLTYIGLLLPDDEEVVRFVGLEILQAQKAKRVVEIAPCKKKITKANGEEVEIPGFLVRVRPKPPEEERPRLVVAKEMPPSP